MYDVSATIFEEYADDLDAEWLIAVARIALSVEGVDESASASIAIADDKTVADLNAEHRGLEDTTDVLSFSPTHSGEYYGDDPFPLRDAWGGSIPDDSPTNPFPLDGGSTRKAGDGGDQGYESDWGRGAHPHPNLPPSRGKELIGGDDFNFILPPDYSDTNIGEVIISLPQARRQAREAGHSRENEIAALLAHGIYHLLGYDHESEEDAERMRPRERAAMTAMKNAGLIQ